MRYDELLALTVEDERPAPVVAAALRAADVVWLAGRLTVTSVEREGDRVVVTYAERSLPVRYCADEFVRVAL